VAETELIDEVLGLRLGHASHEQGKARGQAHAGQLIEASGPGRQNREQIGEKVANGMAIVGQAIMY
jgi:hypothetical protein